MAFVAFVCKFITFFQWRIQRKSFRIVWRMIGLKISINWLVFIRAFRNKRLCRSVIWCIELKRISQICTRLLSKIHACAGEQIRLGPLGEVGPSQGLHWCQEAQGKISIYVTCLQNWFWSMSILSFAYCLKILLLIRYFMTNRI